MLANSIASLLLVTAASALASQIPHQIDNQAGVLSQGTVPQPYGITFIDQMFTKSPFEFWHAIDHPPNTGVSRHVVLKCVSTEQRAIKLRREFSIHHAACQHSQDVLPIYSILTYVIDAHHEKQCLTKKYTRSGNVHSLMKKTALPMPELLAMAIVYRMARALAALHSNNIVHRNINYGSIFMLDNGSFKLSNFQDARYMVHSMQPSQVHSDTHGFLEPEYNPFKPGNDPHQFNVNQRLADVYFLGRTLKILLTNKPGHIKLVELRAELSSSAYHLIAGMTLRDPAKQYTIQHVLKHPWFKSAANHISYDDDLAMHEMKKMADDDGYEWAKVETWLKAGGFVQYEGLRLD